MTKQLIRTINQIVKFGLEWRMENNSQNNGLWYFELIFSGHTQQHIIDLLN